MTPAGATTLLLSAARGDGAPGVSPDTVILGLPLLRRGVLAGERAGFSKIVVEDTPGFDSSRLVAGTRAEIAPPGSPRDPAAEPAVTLKSNVLAQVRWLKELRQGSVEAGSPGPTDAFEIAGPADLQQAEHWLLAGLIKDTEGFMSRHFERPISLAISRRLAATRVTPNAMTLVSVAVGLAGAGLFLTSSRWAPLAGALLVLLHSILDGCDGELARLKFLESRFGGVLDFWGDNVVHSAVFGAIAVQWGRDSGRTGPLLLGAAAILGTVLSAAFVYRHTMAQVEEGPLFTSVSRSPDSAFSRLADALARRDFLYLLVLLAALGKARWFLAMGAVGSPIYFLLLVAIALSGRRRSAPAPESPGAVPVRVNNSGS